MVGPHTINEQDLPLQQKHFNCFYTNTQGLLNKLPELRARLAPTPCDIIAVSETWLTDGITDAEISLSNMSVIRKDRTGRGGGVLVYHHDSISCIPVLDPSQPADTLWCQLNLNNNDSFLLGVIYRPPGSSDEENTKLLKYLQQLRHHHHSHVLIMGDFNCPGLYGQTPNEFERNLLNLMDSFPLYNHVHRPTRFRLPNSPSLLDLILTNEELMIESIDRLTPLGRSDHVVLTFKFIHHACYPNSSTPTTRTITDYQYLEHLINERRWVIDDNLAPQEVYNQMICLITTAVTEASVTKPCRTPTSKSFLRSRTRKWMRTRNMAWQTHLINQTLESWSNYKRIRNRCTNLAKDDKLSYQLNLTNKFISNPKLLYKHVNSLRKVKHGIPPLQSVQGLSQTSKESADALATHYATVFRTDDQLRHCETRFSTMTGGLSNVSFTGSAVKSKLLALRINSSPGIDGIHPKVLFKIANQISDPLASIFQNLFDQGLVPSAWKSGIITPIYKGGLRSDPSNYRPVTLLPVLSKVMESIIADNLMQYLESSGIILDEQHGFRRGRSCMSNLLLARNEWTKIIDQKRSADIMFLDFSKAFDRVNHRLLTAKLWMYGISGPLLNWINEFLTARTMTVRVNKSLS
ncbi:MAG: reverse transcriptase family protein, partial [Candidatus Thiodiazotropha sp.]